MSEQYAVFARLDSDESVRISPWRTYDGALTRWQLWDDTRIAINKRKDGWTNVKFFVVRNADDPQWNNSPLAPERVLGTIGKGSQDDIPVLRRIGKQLGYTGHGGGWINGPGGRKNVAQGWWSFAKRWTDKGYFITREFPTGEFWDRPIGRGYGGIVTRYEKVEHMERRYFANAYTLDYLFNKLNDETQAVSK